MKPNHLDWSNMAKNHTPMAPSEYQAKQRQRARRNRHHRTILSLIRLTGNEPSRRRPPSGSNRHTRREPQRAEFELKRQVWGAILSRLPARPQHRKTW